MSWRITHVDSAGVRRRLHLRADSHAQAVAAVEALHGIGWGASAICIGGRA